MLGAPRMLLVSLAALAAFACSSATPLRDRDAGDGGSDGAILPDGAPWPDSGVWWPDAAPPDIGPACPDPGPPRMELECDVLAQEGCPPGLACYGWTETPIDPCEREVYRTSCFTPGTGGAGAPCGDAGWCAAGLECFITGEGTQCLYVCAITGGEPRCPAGHICRPTDIPGIGACD